MGMRHVLRLACNGILICRHQCCYWIEIVAKRRDVLIADCVATSNQGVTFKCDQCDNETRVKTLEDALRALPAAESCRPDC